MRRQWLVGVLGGLVLLTSCANPSGVQPLSSASFQNTVPAQPKRVVAGILGDPKFLVVRPEISTAPGTTSLEQLAAGGLSRTSDKDELRAELAEAVPSAENGRWKVSPDGRMETTWKIRADAKWQDGAPVTGEDVLFTAQLGKDKELSALYNPAFDSIDSVTSPDGRTVIAQWSRTFIFADTLFTHDLAPPIPRHLLEASYAQNKNGFDRLPFWTQGFIGSGPYRVKEWVDGSHVVMTANEQYVLGRPKVDEIEVRFIADANALMANILAGTIDVTLSRGIAVEQGANLREQWGAGRMEVALFNWFLAQPQFLNPSPAIVGNVQFRKALIYGVDRQEISNALAAGFSPVAHAFVSPNQAVYKDIEPALVKYDYDPRRAGQLLEGLGYVRGGDGMLRDRQNQPLALEIRTTTGAPSPEGMAIIADFWQRAGLTMEQVVVPRQLQNDGEYRANFPAIQFKRTSNTFDVLRRRLHSSEAPIPENRYTGGNDPRYMNPEMDALLDRFVATVGRVERTQILSQIMRRVTDEVVFMGMFYAPNPTLIHNRLVNVGPGSEGATPAWNAHEWDVK